MEQENGFFLKKYSFSFKSFQIIPMNNSFLSHHLLLYVKGLWKTILSHKKSLRILSFHPQAKARTEIFLINFFFSFLFIFMNVLRFFFIIVIANCQKKLISKTVHWETNLKFLQLKHHESLNENSMDRKIISKNRTRSSVKVCTKFPNNLNKLKLISDNKKEYQCFNFIYRLPISRLSYSLSHKSFSKTFSLI